MPILAFFKSDPTTVDQLTIEQVVSNAGNGVLKDASSCSLELREYLLQVLSPKIAGYVDQCLSVPFNKGGMVLQDLINELGRRLDYKVTNGRYQGTATAIGFDGLWLSPEGHSIIVEVKTTDAYRISLSTIAGYRDKLRSQGQISGACSILIVVGREDTGELEAQVRGSPHAWDIRLISADSLINLVQLKENAEGTETALKIRSLLIPREYTRLDQMIDVMFATAKDVEESNIILNDDDDSAADSEEGRAKGSRALLWDASHDTRVACTISKRYTKKGQSPYWFAYHPQWHEFLLEGKTSYLALGCMDLSFAFAIPVSVMSAAVEALNTTTKDDGQTYWHIHIAEHAPGSKYTIILPKKSSTMPIDEYRVAIDA